MANAVPDDYIQSIDDDDDDIDSEAGDVGEAGTSSKQNGEATRQADRYGFVGGDQYTDPMA